MDFSTLVKERRSVRSYQENNNVSKTTLEAILETTLQAPSWKNSETGRYYIASSKEMMDQVRKALPEFNQNSTKNASVYVVAAFEKNLAGFTKGEADNELGNHWGAYDLGLQNAYLILKAKELGLDSLIMGLRDAEKLREIFSIPESQEVGPVIALGYREGEPFIRRRKATEDIAQFF